MPPSQDPVKHSQAHSNPVKPGNIPSNLVRPSRTQKITRRHSQNPVKPSNWSFFCHYLSEIRRSECGLDKLVAFFVCLFVLFSQRRLLHCAAVRSKIHRPRVRRQDHQHEKTLGSRWVFFCICILLPRKKKKKSIKSGNEREIGFFGFSWRVSPFVRRGGRAPFIDRGIFNAQANTKGETNERAFDPISFPRQCGTSPTATVFRLRHSSVWFGRVALG